MYLGCEGVTGERGDMGRTGVPQTPPTIEHLRYTYNRHLRYTYNSLSHSTVPFPLLYTVTTEYPRVWAKPYSLCYTLTLSYLYVTCVLPGQVGSGECGILSHVFCQVVIAATHVPSVNRTGYLPTSSQVTPVREALPGEYTFD